MEGIMGRRDPFVSLVASWYCEAGQSDRSQTQKLVFRENLLSASTSSVVAVSADASLTQKDRLGRPP